MGFIASNLGTLLKYFERLCAFVESMKGALREESKGEINEQSKKLKIDFISKDVLDLVNESLDGAARISKIVQGLKTFSRVDEAEYKFVDVNECMASTLGIVWNELKYKAEVKKEYGRIPPVECFPQQLSQVFMNLLINASQAIEKKGEIKIKTWQQGDNVLVSVADNGQGIAEEHMEKLFEPFFTTKEVGQGTGLGLSIAYEIIQKHHGRIEVASERGVGTRFTITLPITTSVENT
jgi:two-component system NtrC family sensor kinase